MYSFSSTLPRDQANLQVSLCEIEKVTHLHPYSSRQMGICSSMHGLANALVLCRVQFLHHWTTIYSAMYTMKYIVLPLYIKVLISYLNYFFLWCPCLQLSLTFKKCFISHSYLGIVHLIFALNVKMHEIDDAKSNHVILLVKSHLQMTPGPGKFTLRSLLHQYIHKFILAFVSPKNWNFF